MMNGYNLCHVIWKENIEKVRAHVVLGADLNEQGENGHTPLMQAVEMENLKITQYLIAHGAEINLAGHGGDTPLHIAVDVAIDGVIQNNRCDEDVPLEMIDYLIKNGASLKIKNDKGKTALNWAEDYQSKKVIDFLLSTAI